MTSQAWAYVLFAASIFAAAYQTQAGWLFVMGGIGVGTLVVAAALAHAGLAGMRLRALPPGPTYQGEAATLPIVLETTRAWPVRDVQVMAPPRAPAWWFGWWRDALVPERWPYATLDVPAKGRADAALRLPAPVRGEFPVPALVLQSAWPFGLVAATRVARPTLRYLVYPVGPHLDDVPWLGAAMARLGVAARVEVAAGQLLRGVRDYRPGDAWRQIHWRTTARLGTPYVKETEREAGEELVLWLDMRAEAHTAETLEHLVTVAASLAAYARASGRVVRLATQPEAEPEITGRPGDPAWVWLALVQAKAASGEARGPEGAVALSPVPLTGWRGWASAFVHLPGAGAPRVPDATVSCPVGADVPAALAAGSLAP